MECLFCKICRQEIPAEIVYEDPAAVAFLDINPRAPGHAMVIPRAHAASLFEVAPADLGPLFIAVQATAFRLKEALHPQGFTIGINHGKISGQVVEHLHIHIIPRFEGDGGKSLHSVVENPPQESLSVIADKIRRIKKF